MGRRKGKKVRNDLVFYRHPSMYYSSNDFWSADFLLLFGIDQSINQNRIDSINSFVRFVRNKNVKTEIFYAINNIRSKKNEKKEMMIGGRIIPSNYNIIHLYTK